jgi:cellulose synthase operon protein YhjQ
MESRGTDRIDDLAVAETPEDVAVLYSWANLHGAKYRDFSASRREYRAQLRHRAAEQVRQQALLAKAEAEAAAEAAEAAARRATEAARIPQAQDSTSSVNRSLRQAEEAARTAAAERLEAARRAEAAAVAEAAARREEREIAEAHASAQRQAARYADSEIRRRALAVEQQDTPEPPGQISDPYTVFSNSRPGVTSERTQADAVPPQQPQEAVWPDNSRDTFHDAPLATALVQPERRTAMPPQVTPRRPQGYRPDEASGVRQIYRGPGYDLPQVEHAAPDPVRNSLPSSRPVPASLPTQKMKPTKEQSEYAPRPSSSAREGQLPLMGQRRTDHQPYQAVPPQQTESRPTSASGLPEPWPSTSLDRARSIVDPAPFANRDATISPPSAKIPMAAQPLNARPPQPIPVTPRPVSPFSEALIPSDATRSRRAQDDFDYKQFQSTPDSSRRHLDIAPESPIAPSQRPTQSSDPAGPAWLYAPPVQQSPQSPQRPPVSSPPPVQSSVADTLQHSRERVAARWFALKGVFEQPGQEQQEVAPVRQKETRTPVLAVFSLAGGVGKTSLVATVGRALSSMGEKVLLTDTTSHGLLPFYFGASELRQGSVRTFSPPSGSTDAPIYLVSYDVDQSAADEASREQLTEEIINNSRGTHRILLDLTVSSSWIVRHMSRMNPTILVPVAPDMNSVISLQAVEKFFSGVNDGDGRPLQPYYVLNQFDTSLPLHLDIREVMRRQLGERLMPFVIRRAPAVSEALAEGMTVVDYAPDAPIAEDYLNLATWLRTVAAPATAGFRNVRWSER